jgi:hypothetical protein
MTGPREISHSQGETFCRTSALGLFDLPWFAPLSAGDAEFQHGMSLSDWKAKFFQKFIHLRANIVVVKHSHDSTTGGALYEIDFEFRIYDVISGLQLKYGAVTFDAF